MNMESHNHFPLSVEHLREHIVLAGFKLIFISETCLQCLKVKYFISMC